MCCRWCSLTPVNGFDEKDLDNAKQNNYAWSMTALEDYIYVGTGRNIVYQALNAGAGFGIQPPPILTPENPNNDAEIWRYHKSGCYKWERVYKAPHGLELMGFRFMITYKNSEGITAIYAGGFTVTSKSYLLMSIDGYKWDFIDNGIPDGFSTRSMIVHGNKLYMGATNTLQQSQTTYLYCSDNPSKGWQQINFGTSPHHPKGEVISMISFKGHLYLGIAPYGGFEVWRTEGSTPEIDQWKCVVDKGAGDELNELPLSMEVFKNHIYVGTGIWIGFQSIDPTKKIIPPKGFDIIQINDKDQWKVVVGQEALWPTTPITGKRNISDYPSGFGNLFNHYCWQLRAYKDILYIGSWDGSILWATILGNLEVIPQNKVPQVLSSTDILKNMMGSLNGGFLQHIDYRKFNFKEWIHLLITSLQQLPEGYGFDLYISCEGENFMCESIDGLNNPFNYGLRNLMVSEDKLYLGTTNPFQGCEVWEYQE